VLEKIGNPVPFACDGKYFMVAPSVFKQTRAR
jgi:hypothetical protein